MSGSSTGQSRRTPRQDRSRQKVHQILKAADRILRKEGHRAFNTNRIAEESGLSVGSLYEYFPNKESIAEELQDRIVREEARTILLHFEARADAPLSELIRDVVRECFSLYRRNAKVTQSLRTLLRATDRKSDLLPMEQEIVDQVAQRLRRDPQAKELADPKMAAWLIFHTVESLAFQSMTGPFDVGQIEDEAAAIVARYVQRA